MDTTVNAILDRTVAMQPPLSQKAQKQFDAHFSRPPPPPPRPQSSGSISVIPRWVMSVSSAADLASVAKEVTKAA